MRMEPPMFLTPNARGPFAAQRRRGLRNRRVKLNHGGPADWLGTLSARSPNLGCAFQTLCVQSMG